VKLFGAELAIDTARTSDELDVSGKLLPGGGAGQKFEEDGQ
jgi:hypothetical protein